jgi:hypothetical protein
MNMDPITTARRVHDRIQDLYTTADHVRQERALRSAAVQLEATPARAAAAARAQVATAPATRSRGTTTDCSTAEQAA